MTHLARIKNVPVSLEEYRRQVFRLIQTQHFHPARSIVEEALDHYPDDPVLQSCRGHLLSVMGNRYEEGLRLCRQAIQRVEKGLTPDYCRDHLPALYLNLGKTCLSAGRRAEAVKAFRAGLAINPRFSHLIWELQKLKTRQKPPFPFLKRSHPGNRLLGKILFHLQRSESLS